MIHSDETRYSNQSGCFWMVLLIMLLFGGWKVVLGLVGFLGILILFFPFLLIIPIAFLMSNMRRNSTIRHYVQNQTSTHKNFVELFIRILAQLVNIDGRVDRVEITTIRHYFQHQLNFSQTQLLWVKDILKESLETKENIDDLCHEFNTRFAYEPKLILCDLLYRVAFADGRFESKEDEFIQRVVSLLGIRAHDHMSIRVHYVGARDDKEKLFYEVLGCSKGASFDDIRRSYKKMSLQYHPDRVAHLGEEFAKISEEKMKSINEAYQYFKEKHQQ